jgi:hypothetical protein
MQSLALDRATSESKALKLFPAMSAVDMKAALASPHWSAILPLISYLGLQPILKVTRIAFDVIFTAAVRAKATATVDHAIAAHKAFGDVSALGAFTVTVGKYSFRNAFGLHKNSLKNKLRKSPDARSPEPGGKLARRGKKRRA